MRRGDGKRVVDKVKRALRWDDLSPGVRKVLVAIVGGLVLLAATGPALRVVVRASEPWRNLSGWLAAAVG